MPPQSDNRLASPSTVLTKIRTSHVAVSTNRSSRSLRNSVRQHGVLQPIVLRQATEEGRYVIVMGARRYRAAKRAGLRDIPAFIHAVGSADRYVQMIENIQRDDLNAPEIAAFVADRLEQGDNQSDISRKLGKPRDWVSRYASVQSMPEFLQSKLAGSSIRAVYELYQAWREQPHAIETLCAAQESFTDAHARQLARKVRSEVRGSPADGEGPPGAQAARSPIASASGIATHGERPRDGDRGKAPQLFGRSERAKEHITDDQSASPRSHWLSSGGSTRVSRLTPCRAADRWRRRSGRGSSIDGHNRRDPVRMKPVLDSLLRNAASFGAPAERISHPKDGALAQQPEAERAPHSAVERPEAAGKPRSTYSVPRLPICAHGVRGEQGLGAAAASFPEGLSASIADWVGSDFQQPSSLECRACWFEPTWRGWSGFGLF